MTGPERLPAKTVRTLPPRGLLNAKVAARLAKLLVAFAGAATVAGMTAPANADPNPYVYVAGATDDTFLRALDGLGIGHPSDPDAVNIAKDACGYIQGGHSIREAVDGVRNAYPGLPLLQGAHFVAVARALYCPDTFHLNERGADTSW